MKIQLEIVKFSEKMPKLESWIILFDEDGDILMHSQVHIEDGEIYIKREVETTYSHFENIQTLVDVTNMRWAYAPKLEKINNGI